MAYFRSDSTRLVLALIAITVLTGWMTITFSFALHYARRDIESGGLAFAGDEEPVDGQVVVIGEGAIRRPARGRSARRG